MINFCKKTGFLILLVAFISGKLYSQPEKQNLLIDKVVAIVGDKIVKHSDIEAEYTNYLMQGVTQGGEARCQILEELLLQQLLLNQAEIDSVIVSETQVESELDARIRYFINQIGSREKLEEFYKKSIQEIKNEFRSTIRERLLVQTMEAKITKDIKITPKEVRSFYNKIPEDSLPLINSEVEVYHIVKQPLISEDAKEVAIFRLNEIRERVVKGEDFGTLAYMYSEDPGSSKKNGELGFTCRGDLFPEFESAAFALKENEISTVIETKAGYHIIQMLERRGECINVKHILIQPKTSPEDLTKARQYLDNVYALINMDSVSFYEAAKRYSDDPSKNNGGLIVNKYTGQSRFEVTDLDPQIFFTIDKMEVGQISKPVLMKTDEGKQAYRIIFLKTRTNPHKANLKDDYDRIQSTALEDKKHKTIGEWINKKFENTYIRVNEDYKHCDFMYNWFNH